MYSQCDSCKHQLTQSCFYDCEGYPMASNCPHYKSKYSQEHTGFFEVKSTDGTKRIKSAFFS